MPTPRAFWRKASSALGIDRLDWSKAALQFRTRVQSLRKAEGDEWPDVSDEGLAKTTADWLEPFLADKTARSQLTAGELFDAMQPGAVEICAARLDAEAPTHFTAPTGTSVPIDYEADRGRPLSIRVQELFGLTQHPSIAGGRVPLVIELLSPGAQGGADHPRSARLLARQLCRCPVRPAGPLSAPSLAGRPDLGAADPAGQASPNRDVTLNLPLTMAGDPATPLRPFLPAPWNSWRMIRLL